MKYFRDEIYDWFYMFLNVIPGRIGRAMRYVFYRCALSESGKKISVSSGVEISGVSNIALGSYIYIVSGAILRACDRGHIKIGDHFAVNGNARIIADNGGSIIIGNKVMVGPNTVIRASNHAHDRVDIPMWDQGQSPGKIVIGDDVWIAANVSIMPGVTIGKGVIVAAGAVVTKDIPDFVVVGGVPATVISHRTLS